MLRSSILRTFRCRKAARSILAGGWKVILIILLNRRYWSFMAISVWGWQKLPNVNVWCQNAYLISNSDLFTWSLRLSSVWSSLPLWQERLIQRWEAVG